jgi:cytochrome c biogenesis protein CcmG, thiol:disulfide interchange protein DsbE
MNRDGTRAARLASPLVTLLRVLATGVAAVVLAACGGGASVGEPAAAPTDGDALAALRRQANQLLPGGPDAFRARLAALRGHPVVVNQWASWCGPCQYEFPFFADLAERYDGRVAFLGVNSNDSASAARRFLARHSVPFPHFEDVDGSVARVFRGGRAFPTTAFYDAGGRLVMTHAGAYASAAKLDADIRRYALDG